MDKARTFTPRRVLKTKKSTKTIFSDHYSLKVEFKGLPKSIEKDKHESRWNLGKPDGWDIYKEATNSIADKIESLAEDDELDINSVMKKLNTLDTKVKFKSFGKTKPSFKTSFQNKCHPDTCTT